MFSFKKRYVSQDQTLPLEEKNVEMTTQIRRKSRFINLQTFVLVSGVLMCAQSSLTIYTKSVLTSIERRFQISSSLAGLIVGSFNFGNMLFVVLVSKLSANGHRPRIMAMGSIVIALGGFLNVVPHLINPSYDPEQFEATTLSPYDATTCSSSKAYVLLIIGEMLQGIGATVLIPLGSSYIDDFAKSGKSPLYLGIMFLLQNLGPGIGYLVGASTTLLYVDFNKVDPDQIEVNKSDDSWVGAWWLGYIIIGLFVLICAAPLFWFPKNLNNHTNVGKKTIREIKVIKDSTDDVYDVANGCSSVLSNGDSKKIDDKQVKGPTITNCNKLKDIFIDLYQTLKRLITNPVYVIVVLGYSGLMFVTSAFAAFMPKFLEVVFYRTKSQASLIFGLSMPMVICIGLFSGGFIVQRSKLNVRKTMYFIACSSGVTLFLCVPTYYIKCDTESLHECENQTTQNVTKNCIDVHGGDLCKTQCYGFVALTSLSALVGCLIVTPSYSVILRTVNSNDKCTAIGLKFLIIRLLGFIPSPLITGAVFDDSCLKWSESPDCVGTATCLLYNREMLRYSYLHIVVLGVLATFLFHLMGCLIQHRTMKNCNIKRFRKETEDVY